MKIKLIVIVKCLWAVQANRQNYFQMGCKFKISDFPLLKLENSPGTLNLSIESKNDNQNLKSLRRNFIFNL
jgi:hypothetical protein